MYQIGYRIKKKNFTINQFLERKKMKKKCDS